MKTLLAIAVLLFPSIAFGQYSRYQNCQLQNAQGQAIAGAQVYVLQQPTTGTLTPLATVYANSTGSAGPISQPVLTNGFGECTVYAAPGTYTVVYQSPYTGTKTVPDVIFGGGGGAGGGVTSVAASAPTGSPVSASVTGATATPTVNIALSTSGTGSVAVTANTGGIAHNSNCIAGDGSGNIVSLTVPCGTGGGSSPPAPAFSIPFANSAVTAFQSDSNFTINPTTHTLTSAGDLILYAEESTPKVIYDPMSTAYAGGLAAAIAGTSGNTPTQVLQAVIDYGECQYQMGLAPGAYKIPLPAGITINLSSLQFWSFVDFGGESYTSRPVLQHTIATSAMLTTHTTTDTLTCSNGTTYTPAPSGVGKIFLHHLGLAGSAILSAPYDIGIWINGGSPGWILDDIGGAGNGFGGQVILDQGFNDVIRNVGYPNSQLKGCQAYVTGALAITSSPSGKCGGAEFDELDGDIAWGYATDAVQQFPGTYPNLHGAGPCYPNCGGFVFQGSNSTISHLFAQASDIGILETEALIRGEDWRVDAASREGVMISATAIGSTISNIAITSACTDQPALLPNYTAGTATGCSPISNSAQGVTLTGMQFASSASNFGPSYNECYVRDTQTGSTGSPNSYDQVSAAGNAGNTTPNDNVFCGQFGGDHASGRVVFPSMSPAAVTAATVNASGLTSIGLATATPITNINYGISGQTLIVTEQFGTVGASVASTGNITTCSGLPETNFPILLVNTGGYAGNAWREPCITPQSAYVHLNYFGNTAPTNPSVVDFLGDAQAHQVTGITISTSQLFAGSNVGSGSYSFEEEADFADGSEVVSPIATSIVNLLNSPSGEIFVVTTPQATAYKLWLVSNTTGSSIPVGNIGAPSGGSYWPASQIAAGGDGTTAPPASLNTTGTYLAPFGISLNTTGTQPTCNVFYRYRLWTVLGNGTTTTDTVQQCQLTSSGTYAWGSLGGSGGSSSFASLTSGTNTNTLTMGTGGTMTYSGTGVVNANEALGVPITSTPLIGTGTSIPTADALSPYKRPCVQTTDTALGTTGCDYYLKAGDNLQTLITTVSALGSGNTINIGPGTVQDTTGLGITMPSTTSCVNIHGSGTSATLIAEVPPTYAISGAYTQTTTQITFSFASTVPAVGAYLVFSSMTGISGVAAQAPALVTAVSGNQVTVNFTGSATTGTATGTATLVAPYVLGQIATTSTPANCSYDGFTLDGGLASVSAMVLVSMTNLQVHDIVAQNIARGENGVYVFGESSGSYPTTGAEVKNIKCSMPTGTYTSTLAPNYCVIAQTSATDSHFTTVEGTNVKQLYRVLGGSNIIDGSNHIYGSSIATTGAFISAKTTMSGFECDELTSTCINFGTGANGSSITNSFGVYSTAKAGATFASVCSTCDSITISNNNWLSYTGNSITAPVIFPGSRPLNITIVGNTPDFGQSSLGGQYTITSSATPTWNLTNGLNQVLTLSANTTLSMSNPNNIGLPGALLEICQPSGQSYTLTYPSTMKNGSAAPTSGGCITQNWVSEDGVNELATGPTVPLENVVTSATGGTGTSTVTCITTSPCTNLSGSYSVVGGTFTTGAFLTLAWPTTPTSYKCQVNQDGGATNFGIGHGVASPTGITISSSNTIAGATVSVDYSCKP